MWSRPGAGTPFISTQVGHLLLEVTSPAYADPIRKMTNSFKLSDLWLARVLTPCFLSACLPCLLCPLVSVGPPSGGSPRTHFPTLTPTPTPTPIPTPRPQPQPQPHIQPLCPLVCRSTFRRISQDTAHFERFANGLMNETNSQVGISNVTLIGTLTPP